MTDETHLAFIKVFEIYRINDKNILALSLLSSQCKHGDSAPNAKITLIAKSCFSSSNTFFAV